MLKEPVFKKHRETLAAFAEEVNIALQTVRERSVAERDVLSVIRRGEELGLVSEAGMKKSGLLASVWVYFGQTVALAHVFRQATRAINILNNPNGYTPRKKPLYGFDAEIKGPPRL